MIRKRSFLADELAQTFEYEQEYEQPTNLIFRRHYPPTGMTGKKVTYVFENSFASSKYFASIMCSCRRFDSLNTFHLSTTRTMKMQKPVLLMVESASRGFISKLMHSKFGPSMQLQRSMSSNKPFTHKIILIIIFVDNRICNARNRNIHSVCRKKFFFFWKM